MDYTNGVTKRTNFGIYQKIGDGTSGSDYKNVSLKQQVNKKSNIMTSTNIQSSVNKPRCKNDCYTPCQPKCTTAGCEHCGHPYHKDTISSKCFSKCPEPDCKKPRTKFCSSCGNKSNNYEKTFSPWKFANKNPNFGFWRRYVAGGILGALVNWEFLILVVATIGWAIFFWLTGYDITRRSIFSSTYDSSLPAFPALFCNLLMGLSGILFASGIAFAYGIYRSMLTRFDDIASSFTHISTLMSGFIRWHKVCKDAVPCHKQTMTCELNGCDNSKDSQPNVLIIIRDLIYLYTLKPYFYKHFFRGRVEIHNQEGVHEGLPLPPDVKNQLVTKLKEQGNSDLTNDEKNDEVDHAIFARHAWLAERGYLLNKDGVVAQLNDIVITSRGVLGTMSTDQSTPKPTLIAQLGFVSTMTLYILLIPVMWSMYAYIIGSIFLYTIIPIAIGFLKGLPRIQAIFDNPEDNPTIGEKNVGFRSHALAAEINAFWIRQLNNKGFVMDNVHDKFSRISKIEDIEFYKSKK